MKNIFVSIYDYFVKHRAVLIASFTLCLAAATYFALQVKLEEDISKILPSDKKTEKLNQVFQQSKFMDRLVMMVSLKDTLATEPDSLVIYADALEQLLNSSLSDYIDSIHTRIDDEAVLELFGVINEHLPVYLTESDYQEMDSLIHPETIQQTLQQNIRTLTSPAGFALKKMIQQDPVGISFLGLKKLQQLQYDENFELYDGYIVTKDHRNLLFFITPEFPPNNTGKNAYLMETLDGLTDSLSNEVFPGISSAYFGATAVSVGNALQLRKDSLLTQGITLLFLVIFLAWFFRKKRAPFIILIPVVFGALFSLACIYFLQGAISVIAIGTGSVVLGIAVNYSLHVFNHYRHTRTMRQVIHDLSFPLTIGSFTTVGGFLCLQFVESEMLKDLGLFAAFSLIGASLCSLIFLPHFIETKNEDNRKIANNFSWIDKLASLRPEYNKLLVLVILGLTVFFGIFSTDVGFESDMTKMNYMSPKLLQAEKKLNQINAFSLQSVYLISEGNNLDEALKQSEHLNGRIDQLKAAGLVKKSTGVNAVLFSDSLQKARITRWNNWWTPEKKTRLLETLEQQGKLLGYNASAFIPFNQLINKNFEPVSAEASSAIQSRFLSDYISEKDGQTAVVTLAQVPTGQTAPVYEQFENTEHVTVVDRQYLTNMLVGIINKDFSRIALFTSLLVFVVFLVTFGRVELALTAFIPMFITWIWILGIMGLLGISFNIVNIIISALIFGLGDDYSIFIMDGMLQEYKTGKKNLSSYKSSIFLSAIATVTGLGVLIFAEHPALKSIALISIIGILCVVIMAQILIPFFFTLIIKNRVKNNRLPWTAFSWLKSVFAFSYFVVGCILLTLAGLILAKLNPFNKEKGKLFYHKLLAGFCRSLLYVMTNVKKNLINPLNERLTKPAVIICNHQSFLDILCMVMLNPRILLFTNKWVWNSPVFGAVVRLADYFPIIQGVEANTDQLANRIKEGYSIMIFPEGTRSVDGKIKRFHKGAFYLAEKLQLDILPILIHGSGYTMTKGDFMLKDGEITLKFLPRITPSNADYGHSYAEKAKLVGRYFRKEYEQLSLEKEQPQFFKQQLIHQYLFKGPVLEWYMKVKLRLENYYRVFHDIIPRSGKMLDLGCGYGFMPSMLNLAAPQREFTAIDYDETKIEVARNSLNPSQNVSFECVNVSSFELDYYDTILISDMLHYLHPEQQEQLLVKCFKHLNKGGLIIIRDGNPDLARRHKGTRLTELFSTRIFKFNKTMEKGLSFLSAQKIRSLAEAHNMICEEIDQTKFTSNIIYIIKNEPGIE